MNREEIEDHLSSVVLGLDTNKIKLVQIKKLDLITKAMSACTGDGSFILKQKYLDNRLAYITRTRLNISHSTYSCHLNQALIEFADCLYFLTRNCGDEIIDLRVKKDQTKQA